MRWKLFRRIGLAVLVVLVVAVVAVGAVGWSWVRKPLPQTTGELTLSGLTSPVTVLRDEQGVPQIYADNAQDLFRAQGYVHAQDRFFEMDLRRHVTAGRLAELVGPAGFDSDVVVRTLGWRRVAERELPLLAPETRQYLQAYADGVNAYLHTEGAPAHVSLEYSLLNLRFPEPTIEDWTPVDSLAWLKAMAWDLKADYTGELDRAQLAGRMTTKQIAEVFPAYPFGDHAPILSPAMWSPSNTPARSVVPSALTAAPTAATAVTAAVTAAPNATGQSGGTSADQAVEQALATAYRAIAGRGTDAAYAAARDSLAAVPQLLGRGENVGSNSWVVAGSRTTTGRPLLANDPHLATSLPGVWYQVGLHCTTVTTNCPFDVAGFSFSGMPGVIIGHNDRVAWAMTNLRADVTDFYLEKVRGDASLKDGSWVPMDVRSEVIRVAGQSDRTVVVRATPHGPVLSDANARVRGIGTTAPVAGAEDSGTYAVALAWTGLEPSATADAIFGLNKAHDFASFRTAAAAFAVPAQNLLYADVDGHIGYQTPGLVPVRVAATASSVPGYWPAPGWSTSYDWKGWVPFDKLPFVLDPAEGFLVAANQAVTPSASPFLTTEWDMGYRSQRIRQLLTATKQVSPQDVAAVQLDTKDLFAPTLVKALLTVPIDDPFVAEGQKLLRTWDGTMPSGKSEAGAAASYYNAVWANLLALTFDDEMGGLTATGDSRWMRAMAVLLDKPKSAWWDNKQTPTIVEGRDEILRQAMVQARLDLTERIGKDTRSWQWGELHTVTLRGPLADALPGPLAALFTEGPVPVSGGTSLVNAMSWDSAAGYQVVRGPSMRMVVDLADLDASRWVNQSGQSGHPTDAHFADQLETWASGGTYAWPFTRSAVDKTSVETLTLAPSTR